MSDAFKFGSNSQHYVEEYERTGEVPEEFQKYCDPKYDQYFEASGYKNFEGFYAAMIESVKSGGTISPAQDTDADDDETDTESREDDNEADDSSSETGNGEKLVDLNYTGANAGMTLRAI